MELFWQQGEENNNNNKCSANAQQTSPRLACSSLRTSLYVTVLRSFDILCIV